MVSVMEAGLRCSSSIPARALRLEYCVVFLGKTLYFHSSSLRVPRRINGYW